MSEINSWMSPIFFFFWVSPPSFRVSPAESLGLAREAERPAAPTHKVPGRTIPARDALLQKIREE